MSVSAVDTREEKKLWLMRPVLWASHVSWFAAFFSPIYFWYGIFSDRVLIVGLIAALALNAGLLIWGIRRMHVATQRSY